MAIRLLLVAVVAAVAFGIQATLPGDSAEAGSAPASVGSEGIAQQPAAFPFAQDGGIAGENGNFCTFFLGNFIEATLGEQGFSQLIEQSVADFAEAEFNAESLGENTDLDNLVRELSLGTLQEGAGFEDLFLFLILLCKSAFSEIDSLIAGVDAIPGSPFGGLAGRSAGGAASSAAGDPGADAPSAAGAAPKFTVNSDLDVGELLPAFIGDGVCDITGAGGLGPCTLRAAIQEANAQGVTGGVINFDPAIFPPDPQITPTDIILGSNLPPIVVDDLTINVKGATVVIDASDEDGVFGVYASGPNFDFTLNGGKSLTILDVDQAAIFFCGDDFDIAVPSAPAPDPFAATDCDGTGVNKYFDDVTISGVTIGVGTPSDPVLSVADIAILGVASNIRTHTVTNSTVLAEFIGWLPIAFGGAPVPVLGDGLFSTKWHYTGNTTVSGVLGDFSIALLPIITGTLATDVQIDMNDNPKIGTFSSGIALLPIVVVTAANDSIVFNMNDNGQVKANQSASGAAGGALAALPILIVGCGPKCGIAAEINMNGNAEVSAVDDGGVVTYLPITVICCGPSDSTSVQRLDDNDVVTGESPGFGLGALFINFVCCGDDNVADVSASRNGRIFADDIAILSLNLAGDFTGGPADDNLARATFDGNGRIEGEDLIGIFAVNVSGTLGASDAETNSSVMSASDNTGTIVGGVFATLMVGFAGSVADEGDDNTSTMHYDRNGVTLGEDEATIGVGVALIPIAGGPDPSSDDNTTVTTLNENDDIISLEGLAIGVLAVACCGDDNTNVLDISDNEGEITGEGGVADLSPAIGVVFCCSTNIGTINDNEGIISGSGLILGAGIAIFAIPVNPITGAPSITNVDIAGNQLVGSEQEGIIVCCGLWLGSQWQDNLIAENGQSGVFIIQSSNITVGPDNVLRNNGTGTGVTICCSSIPSLFFVLGANYNRITQNSIFDNIGLGIDLTFSPVVFDAVACPLIFIGTGGNTCLPAPGFPDPYIVTNGKLVGQAGPNQIIEVFIADGDPPDQCTVDGCFGEGREYVMSVTADGAGAFSATLPCGLEPGFLTVTGTRLAIITLGSFQVPVATTSEFSENVAITGSPSCATATPTVTNTPPPTATFTPAPPTATFTPVAPAKACGDVNDSGSVNSVDAQLVLQFKAALIPSLPNPESADVNGDGDITSVDAALILQLEAGLISSLSC